MIDKKVKVPVREQEPKVRAGNFKEVCYGYDTNEAMLEATRCLNCKNPRCVQACPVGVNIPSFIAKVKDGDIEAAAQIIAQNSSLPAVCGRVCPQESQCEGSCVVGIKNEAVSIGKLERFVADWARERDLNVSKKDPSNGIKVAVIGSGPSGLACAVFIRTTFIPEKKSFLRKSTSQRRSLIEHTIFVCFIKLSVLLFNLTLLRK